MPSSRRAHLVHEIPLLMGLGLGWFLCWWRGRAFVSMTWPAGFDWERYLRETWAFTHPGTMVSTWLEPLYPWLLSTLGTDIGWASVGLFISSAAMVGLVLGGGLLGRAMAGPWAGAVAAVAIPLTPQLAAAARWVNMYPLLSATTSLGLAGAVGFARWSRWPWAVLGGVGLGLAWGVDSRTITLIPGMVLLVVMGLQGIPGWTRRGALAAVFLLGLGLGPASQKALRVMPRETTAEVAVILRGIELSKISQSEDVDLREACRGEPAVVIHPAGLLRPCATALQADNAPRVDRALPLGLGLTLLLLPLALLPGRGGRRRSAIALLALAPFMLMTWIMSRWIIITPRYMMQIAAPAAVVGPVALIQLVCTLRARPHWAWMGVAGAVGLGVWQATEGPDNRGPYTPLEQSSTYQMMVPIVEWIQTQRSPEEGVLDCSESHIAPSFYPQTLIPPPQDHEGHDWLRCGRWIREGPAKGAGILVTGTRTRVPGVDFRALPAPWRLQLRTQGMGQEVRLWRWTRRR